MKLRHTAASIVLSLLVHPLAAQTGPTSPFARLLDHYLDSLKHDTLVQRLGSGLQLGDVLRPDMLLRLSDSSLVTLADLYSTSLQQVDSTMCAYFAPGGTASGHSFMELAYRADSATAKRWLVLVHQLVLTGLLDQPRGRIVSLDTAFLRMGAILQSLPPEEHAQMRAAMTHPSASLVDRCRFAQLVFRGLANLPPDQAGPTLRAFMSLGMPQ